MITENKGKCIQSNKYLIYCYNCIFQSNAAYLCINGKKIFFTFTMLNLFVI